MADLLWTVHDVYVKTDLSAASWGDPVAHLLCPTLTRGLAPTLPQATLLYQFGTIDGAYVPRLDLVGKYVRIDVREPVTLDGEPVTLDGEQVYLASLSWVGKVLTEQLERWPQEDDGFGVQRLKGGNQSFGVTGLEWFLARTTINHAMIYTGAGLVKIDRAMGFNTGFGDGRDITYAERGNKDSRGLGFAEDADHTAIWTATQIVQYLIAEHTPRDKDDNLEPATFELAANASDYLDGFAPIVRVESHSLWQVLNAVISPHRGLTWWTEYIDGSNIVRIRVSSMATVDVALPGGGTLPAASNALTIADLDGTISRPTISARGDRKYDRVVCRGARRRSVFTASFDAGTLEPSWKSTEETAYKAAAADPDGKVNDRFRQANRFERVFQCFQIPTSWDGDVDTGVHACPSFVQGSGSIVGKEKLHLASLRLLPSLPLKVGWDYTNATAPTPRDPTNIRSEFQRPFALVDIGSSEWRFTHEINANDEADGQDRRTSYHLRVMQGTPGFQLAPGGGMPHCLALNHIDPDGADASSDHLPEVDYDTLQATVCAEWDAYCEGYFPVVEPTNDPLQTLYINIDERARFDWLAEGTVFDVEGGALSTVTTAGALRDDRGLCADIARLAYEWSGVTRAEFGLELATVELPVDVGDLITTVGSGAALETVNAVVSQITHNLEAGTTSISAGFAELDFATL